MHKIGSGGSKAAVCATSKTARDGVVSIRFILVCRVVCRVVLGLNLVELVVVVQGLLGHQCTIRMSEIKPVLVDRTGDARLRHGPKLLLVERVVRVKAAMADVKGWQLSIARTRHGGGKRAQMMGTHAQDTRLQQQSDFACGHEDQRDWSGTGDFTVNNHFILWHLVVLSSKLSDTWSGCFRHVESQTWSYPCSYCELPSLSNSRACSIDSAEDQRERFSVVLLQSVDWMR